MRKFIFILCILLAQMTVHAAEEPKELYAQSAVLMDAKSGRVLFEKMVLKKSRWQVQQR